MNFTVLILGMAVITVLIKAIFFILRIFQLKPLLILRASGWCTLHGGSTLHPYSRLIEYDKF